MNGPKEKECKICQNTFLQFKSTVVVCSVPCAIAFAKEKEKQKFKKQTRKMKLAFNKNNRSYMTNRAQNRCNRYIRLRDKNLPCISCGSTSGEINAGHYRSAGSCPELRFHEDNIHKQCVHCNKWKSSNAVDYRIGLVVKIGLGMVEWLEGPHEPQNRTLEDLDDIYDWYTIKIAYLDES